MKRELKVFRLVDNRRVPVTLVLDSSLVIVDEIFDHAALSVAQFGEDQEKRTKMMLWTLRDGENNLPGTDELRAKFFEAMTSLEESYAGNCPPCKKGTLIAEYRKKLEEDGYI